jgi:glycosyltransferase involved in cell wall biosynthesis
VDTSRRRPTIVISAVNFVEGGPLSVLTDCLAHASRHLTERFDVVALVHRKSLISLPGIRLLEFPAAKRSWWTRLLYEYWIFRGVSLELAPELWLSLHDITPNVRAHRRAVYCHNPAPFYRPTWREGWLDPSFAAFSVLYKWLYRINIHQNDFVIVQQDWLRSEFQSLFGLENVVVAHPEVGHTTRPALLTREKADPVRFIYPALPRVFKNFEVICEATKWLVERNHTGFEVVLTIDGGENRYARQIRRRYGDIEPLRFIGRQSRDEIFRLYESSDCLLFPSRLETWGMPLTEFQFTNRPIIAADLKYAQETVGAYPNAAFFDAGDSRALAALMERAIEGNLRAANRTAPFVAQPFVQGWGALFDVLLTSAPTTSQPEPNAT